MEKKKFVLTSDMIKVEEEPSPFKFVSTHNDVIMKRDKLHSPKSRISLNIDQVLKCNLQLFCVKNSINMTEFIELLIKKELEIKNK